jgi:hypothetical protein
LKLIWRVDCLLKKVEMKIAAYIQLHTAYECIHSKDIMFLLINKQHRNNEESTNALPQNMTAASAQVFAIPELLESILLSLPATRAHEELSSIRTIIVCQRVCRTWLAVIKNSRHICEFCYSSWSPSSSSLSSTSTPPKPLPPLTWTQTPTLTPPFRPNPYISTVILSPQSQTSTTRTRKDPWLFNGDAIASRYGPPQPKNNNNSNSTYTSPQTWTFFLQISRSQFLQFLHRVNLQQPEGWREMYVTNPPFCSAWFTRCGGMPGVDGILFEGRGFQSREVGHGGNHEDDDEDEADSAEWTSELEAEMRFRAYGFAKRRQRSVVSREGGLRLGDLVDGLREAFGVDGDGDVDGDRGEKGWVAVESCRLGEE